MRAALYARFSSDLQNPASIADQLRAGRRHAEKLGATVVAEFTDISISAAAAGNRPGFNDLLAAAQAGAFDVVIAEALDRLTRHGGDAWYFYLDLQAADVAINTVSEGRVDEMAIGFKGTMNALFLKELRLKVKRGHEGVLRDGRHVGAHPYGYRPKIAHDAKGERIKGLLEVDPEKAEIVRRAAREFLAGSTGHAVVHRLNADGVVGPGGRPWTYDQVIGRPGELRGLLRNPIYAGELVLNRTSKRKDHRTGRTRTVPNPSAEWLRQEVPELAVLDAQTWRAVQARLEARSAAVKVAGNPSAANQPRRLLAGLIRCGVCGGPMNTAGPKRGYRCLARMRVGKHACSNERYAAASRLEAEVVDYLRTEFLHPAAIEEFVREYHRARAADVKDSRAQRVALERELSDVRRKSANLVDQVAEGILKGPTVAAKLAELEARAAALQKSLDALASAAEVVTIHPKAAERYRELFEHLQAAIADAEPSAELDEARAAIRAVVREIRIIPGARRGEWTWTIVADPGALLGSAGDPRASARDARNA